MPRLFSRAPPRDRRAAALVLVLLALVFPNPSRADAPGTDGTLGTTLDGVLTVARRLSPDLAARALDTEAAQARVAIAGALPDPTLRITSDEIDRTRGPRQNKMIYSFEQEVPLWGKRDLKRDQATAEVARSRADARQTEAELIEKVKITFAQYYQADQAIRTTEGLHRVVHDIAKVTRERYAQGRGSQQEVYKAELETTRLSAEILRLEAARQSASARLNALLARPIDAPLGKPRGLRALPNAAALTPASLMVRARATNPILAGAMARIAGAEAGQELAERSWYPDVTLSAGAIDRGSNGPPGYMATVGFKIPLQWGMHEAEQREAGAQVNAAQARQRGLELQIQGDLGEALAALNSNRRLAELIRGQQIPQNQALLRSGVSAYGLGKGELADVLRTEHDLADLRVQLLNAEFEAQHQLAAVERLIGSSL